MTNAWTNSHMAADLPARYVRRVASPDLGTPHSLAIDGAPEQVSAARAFVRQVLGSSHPGAERVTLLTSELVTNSVNHSNSRLEGGTVTVTLRVAVDRILVEVADDGGTTVPTLRRNGDLAEAISRSAFPGENYESDDQGTTATGSLLRLSMSDRANKSFANQARRRQRRPSSHVLGLRFLKEDLEQ